MERTIGTYRSVCCSFGAFGPVPDPAKHLLGHQEADRLDWFDEETLRLPEQS